MVDSMDRAIGRVLDQLRAMKAFDDTLILFMSDNGASAEVMVVVTGMTEGTTRPRSRTCARCRLVDRQQYAVCSAQDLGARRWRVHAVGGALADGHCRARRVAPDAGARD